MKWLVGLGLAVLGLLVGVTGFFMFDSLPTTIVGAGLLGIGLLALK